MDEGQLSELGSEIPGFIGVFACDETPQLRNNECLIANTLCRSDHNKMGHWVALLNVNGRLELFDSVVSPISRHLFYYDSFNTVSVQKRSSDSCGYYSLLFLLYRVSGVDFATTVRILDYLPEYSVINVVNDCLGGKREVRCGKR